MHVTEVAEGVAEAERLIYKVLHLYGGSSKLRKRWGEWKDEKTARGESEGLEEAKVFSVAPYV